MTTERSIFDDFAQRLNLGIASIKEQMERTFGPQGSSVRTAVKKQLDDQIFMSILLDSLEREKEEIMAAKRLAAEKWAAADEQTAPTKVNNEQPKAAVEKKAAPTPGYIEVLIKRIQNLLRKLDALIEFYDQQSQHLTQQQEVVMEQVVLPALEQLRPVPTIPILHTLSDGRDIVLNPLMNDAYEIFREDVMSRPEAIHTEQDVYEVLDRAVDRVEVQNPPMATRERKPYPYQLEDHDVASVKNTMKQTYRHHPQYEDSYADGITTICRGLSVFQLMKMAKQVYNYKKESALSVQAQVTNLRPAPGVERFLEERDEFCEIEKRHTESLVRQIAKAIPPLLFTTDEDLEVSNYNNRLPRLKPQGPFGQG